MGCLIAMLVAIQRPEAVNKLILLGPPPCPVPAPAREGLLQRAGIVRKAGTMAIANAIVAASTSQKTKESNSLALSLVRMSILSTHPEGYAQGFEAFANARESFDLGMLPVKTMIITGTEDQVSSPAVAEKLAAGIAGSELHILQDVGHQHAWEDAAQVTKLLEAFMQKP